MTAPWFNKLLVASLPLIPRPIVKMVSSSYVAGETMDEMLETVRKLNTEGARCTVDLLGEFITHIDQAHETARHYRAMLEAFHQTGLNASISIKLTALGLLLDKDVCAQLTRDLVTTAAQFGNFVRIDMEDTPCTDDTIALYLALRKDFTNVGIVLQAYLRRTLGDVRHICDQRAGNFRICKGIYNEPRQLAYKDRDLINKNYTLVMEEMMTRGAYVGIATHDEALTWEACRLLDKHKIHPDKYEFQMLLGVDPELRGMLLASGHPLRVYVPYGKQWYEYSTRRLKENPTIAGYVFKQFLDKVLGFRFGKPSGDAATASHAASGSFSMPMASTT